VLPYPNGPWPRVELGPVLANGSVISNAYPQDVAAGWQVVFDLTSKGTTIFNQKIAAPNYHYLVANDLDGVVETAPQIDATSFSGSGEISGGGINAQTAGSLSLLLKYGALPIGVHILTSDTVSPSLGSSSLHAGILAGLLGLALVMGYTIFYYRALGVVVVLGLVSTAGLLYGIIASLGHSAGLTLDLSGITGLIVSVGITVDSYVVYFERLKDEVRAGRSIRSSVDKGFKSAYRTILSADAVSFIGALVLYLLSIGAVKGFALMLGISTLLDVITAYFFTRPLVILLGRNRLFTEARGFGVARGLGAPSAEARA
jgi:preprotein translocase subunit SecD